MQARKPQREPARVSDSPEPNIGEARALQIAADTARLIGTLARRVDSDALLARIEFFAAECEMRAQEMRHAESPLSILSHH